jgi:glycosyltransferase involved in cell wall biosynthesis
MLRRADKVIVFSKEQSSLIQKKYGIKIERIAIVPNGVGQEFFYKNKRNLHHPTRLLFIGRLSVQKNLSQFLNALNGISEQFETNIVGHGELESDLKKEAKNLKLQNINFTGHAQGEKLLNFYKQADIFVLPSEREGMPLVLLEAMAMGLPILATDVIGNREVIKNGKNGLLVPLNDVASLRNALLRLKTDEKQYNTISEVSGEMAQSYSWNKVIKKLEKLYEEVYV